MTAPRITSIRRHQWVGGAVVRGARWAQHGRRLLAATPFITSAVVVGVLLSAMFLAEARWFADRHSLVYDETVYLNLSIRSVRERGLDPRFMTFGVAPLPVWLTHVRSTLLARNDVRSSESLFEPPTNAPELIRAPRFLTSLLVGVPLVLTVFC